MKKGELLDKMLLLATQAHHGILDKGGRPYILHCLTVMQLLNTDDEELQCIALGHDLLEDTYVTGLVLEKQGFPYRVIHGIDCMTKKHGQPYEEYKRRVMANPDSVKVKMADLTHNSDIRRLKGVTEKDIARTVKYHEFYLQLQSVSA